MQNFAQYVVEKLSDISVKCQERYAASEDELIKTKSWQDLSDLQKQIKALETLRFPTVEELIRLSHSPNENGVHMKVAEVVKNANSS